ncbi:MAG: hypothetical protein Q8R16_02770 [bacterium]|nr:hypothetical protein [bacterium]
MSTFLRRAGAILWFVFGFAGLGVLVGFFWLDDALSAAAGMTPAVVLAPAGIESRGTCALPNTIEAFHRGRAASGATSLSTYVDGLVRCARNPQERDALVVMLHTASAAGDALAARGLEAIIRSSCETLATVSVGTPHASTVVETCVELTMVPSVAQSDDVKTRARTLRVAQQLALIEAGVSTEEITAQFCADIGLLPSAVYDQLSVLDPAFTPTVAQACEVHPHADDAGVEEE